MIGWGICQVLPYWRRAFVCRSAVCTQLFSPPVLAWHDGWPSSWTFDLEMWREVMKTRFAQLLSWSLWPLHADGRDVRSPPIVCLPTEVECGNGGSTHPDLYIQPVVVLDDRSLPHDMRVVGSTPSLAVGHAGTLGNSFTYSCLCALAWNSDAVSVL